MTGGALMGTEASGAPTAFARAAGQAVTLPPGPFRAVSTVALGSSDAALILADEVMREDGTPATSLPPSAFPIGEGAALDGSPVLLVSRSGASDDLVACARGARGRAALHAEAFSASGGILVPVLDAGPEAARPSLDLAARRPGDGGAQVHRVGSSGAGASGLTPAAAAALLPCLLYPVVREVALARGQDPDAPSFLSKAARAP